MKKNLLLLLVFCTLCVQLPGQIVTKNNSDTPKIQLPDIPGYITMKCDFHMHTVFSDGVVWPRVRVQEAVEEGLDAISITDHVESSPRYIEDNHIAGFEMAKRAARNEDLLIIPGGEISASKDHFNALFITNQDEPGLSDVIPEKRIRAAIKQDAFVFWNHPGWTPVASTGMAPFNEKFIDLMKEGLVQGIEVCNGTGYWENALKMAIKYDLTLIGNSDIHGVSHFAYQPDKHRTVTLVFAKEKTVEGVREALQDRRTAVYQGDNIIGNQEFLEPLFIESLDIKTSYRPNTQLANMTIINNSDIDFACENIGDYSIYNSPHFFTIKAHSTTVLTVKTIENMEKFELKVLVLNAIVAPGKSMRVILPVTVGEED